MWINEKNIPARGFSTPPPARKTRPASEYPLSERKHRSPSSCKPDLFHVMHKVPAGDSPYVRAKHVQLIDKEPSKAVSLFWAAINSGDRVDSALKDMAVVMKQLNRSEEAIEAIKSFRHLCPHESQESLDNLLVELYKRSGRVEEEIEMLQHKLKRIEDKMAFGGKRTKTARSQGKKIQITVEQERSRILGNLAWACLQQCNYGTAEELYRKALAVEPDNNKQCNLAICLMHMNRIREAKSLLQTIRPSCKDGHLEESFAKSFERASQMLSELESSSGPTSNQLGEDLHKIQKPFTSPIVKNSKETATFTSQCRDSCFVIPGSSPYGNGERGVLLRKQNKVSHCQNYHENKDMFSGRDEGNLKYISFGTVSIPPRSSPKASFYNEWKEGGAVFGNSFGRMPEFSSRRKENWVGMTGTRVGFSHISPVRAIPKTPLTQPRRGSWFFSKGDDRRGFWGDDAVGASSHKPSFEHGDAQSMPMESQRVVVGNERMETFVGKSGEYSSDATLSCSMGVKVVEKEYLGKNNSGLPPRVSENPTPNFCRTKSWADMVEEEDQEFLCGGSIDIVDNKCSDVQCSREGFYDENLNSNIVCPPPCAPNQMENLSKNFESFDLKDDYVNSDYAFSSRNLSVRRSLCFDQQHNPDLVEYGCSSPLLKKALDFEGETREFSVGKYIPPMRRNRLQVFQNITRLPETP